MDVDAAPEARADVGRDEVGTAVGDEEVEVLLVRQVGDVGEEGRFGGKAGGREVVDAQGNVGALGESAMEGVGQGAGEQYVKHFGFRSR